MKWLLDGNLEVQKELELARAPDEDQEEDLPEIVSSEGKDEVIDAMLNWDPESEVLLVLDGRTQRSKAPSTVSSTELADAFAELATALFKNVRLMVAEGGDGVLISLVCYEDDLIRNGPTVDVERPYCEAASSDDARFISLFELMALLARTVSSSLGGHPRNRSMPIDCIGLPTFLGAVVFFAGCCLRAWGVLIFKSFAM